MPRKSRESQFSEDLDRMFAGTLAAKEIEADPEYRSNFEFAGKVMTARSTPSPVFQADLKRKLLAQLAEAEEANSRRKSQSFAWLSELFAGRPAWQTATAASVVIAAIAMLVFWRAGLFSSGQTPIVTIPSPTVAIEATAVIDKSAYAPGELVQIQFSFHNLSNETLTFAFPPSFRIETLSAEAVKSFSVGTVSQSLSPGDSVSYAATWDQRNSAGDQVVPGEYQIVLPNLNLAEAGYLSLPSSPTIVIGSP